MSHRATEPLLVQASRNRRRTLCVAAGLLPIGFARQSLAEVSSPADARAALIIGNSSYKQYPLRNPGNDARAVARSFQQLGYETDLKVDLGFREMISSIRDFTERSTQSSLRVFYFAGHGLQIRGRNHLLPVDLDELTSDNLPAKTLALDDVLDRFAAMPKGANIIILDACRANPFTGSEFVTSDGRRLRFRNPVKQGLASVNPPYGTLVAFSTGPGSVAHDNPRDPIGLYAKHLLAQLEVPGIAVEQLFKAVRAAVAQETSRLQVPWETSSLTGNVCLHVGATPCR